MDRIEMFGNIAHNIVPKVEHMLDWIDEAIAQPLKDWQMLRIFVLKKWMNSSY
jgi:hypothetical protein